MTIDTSGIQTIANVLAGSLTLASLMVPTAHACQTPGSLLFDTARSFVGPDAGNKAALSNLIKRLQNPGSLNLLLITGHTDSVGSQGSNQQLSYRRTQSTQAVLKGDTDQWETLFGTEGWATPELSVMVIETGDADPKDPATVSQAVKRYSGSANASARADLFRRYFGRLLGGATVPAIQPATPPLIGYGAEQLLHGDRGRPSRDTSQPAIEGDFRPNRRVEFFFFDASAVPVTRADYPKWTAVCSLTPPVPPEVNAFYVGPNGIDVSENGSQTKPWKTILFGLKQIAERRKKSDQHMTLKILPGDYTEQVALQSETTLEGVGGPDKQPVLHGVPDKPVVEISNTHDVTITNLKITGGKESGIRVEKSNKVTISNCQVTENFAPRGGGIAIINSGQQGAIEVMNNIIERNEAGTIVTAIVSSRIFIPFVFEIELGNAHGGGVYVENSQNIFIHKNVIQGNKAILFGGGIAVDNKSETNNGLVEIADNEITCNQVSHGDLLPLQHPAITCNVDDMQDPFMDRVREENGTLGVEAASVLHGVGKENGLGGGIALRHVTSQTRLLRNQIGKQSGNTQYAPNRARRGGGIECYIGAYPYLESNSIASNLSSDDGGGIAIDQFDPFLPKSDSTFFAFSRGTFFPRQSIRMVNNEIILNSCIEDGGGIYATGNAQVEISGKGTLIKGNLAGQNGGGVRASYATHLTITGATISTNKSNIIGTENDGGGGVAARNAEVHLADCDFQGNVAANFAGGAIYFVSAFEGGFSRTGFIANKEAQFDSIMENDYGFTTRRYTVNNCKGNNNQATGNSGAGGFLYAIRDGQIDPKSGALKGGKFPIEVVIEGFDTQIGENTSQYNNGRNKDYPGGKLLPLQKRGNVVVELSGLPNEDSITIFPDSPPIPRVMTIAASTPAPSNFPVVIIHHNGRPDDNPTTFPYQNFGPSIISVFLPFGSVQGKDTVTITGSGLLPGVNVTFDDLNAEKVEFISSTILKAVTPKHTHGKVTVSVINPDSQHSEKPEGYEYLDPPAINKVEPGFGAIEGKTKITILGSNFRDGAKVFIGNQPAKIIDTTPTEITVLTPASPTGKRGTVNITLLNIDGQANSKPASFEYTSPPDITNVNPRVGPITGGTDITITGSNFRSGVVVFIGDTLASNITGNPAGNQITATTAGLSGAIATPVDENLTVRNLDNQEDTISNGFTYE